MRKMESITSSLTGETMDISKLKVPDLKRELKARGLSTTGNKSELMERLQKNYLEEVLLNEEDDDDEHLDVSESGIADLEATIEVPAISKTQKRKTPPMSDYQDDQPKQAKKIVLNRNTSIGAQEQTQNGLNNTDKKNGDEGEAKKIVKLSELSAKERLEMRAKKFGVALPAEAKKAVRAERFGTNNTLGAVVNSSNKIAMSVTSNVDVLKQRAQRFGMSVSPVMTKLNNEEQLEKRKRRFGANASSQIDKAKERLERFKMPVK